MAWHGMAWHGMAWYGMLQIRWCRTRTDGAGANRISTPYKSVPPKNASAETHFDLLETKIQR